VEQLGGQPTPAVGFAMGMERLVLMLETLELNADIRPAVDVYLCMVGEGLSRLASPWQSACAMPCRTCAS
jgi:histidyl-tRNA synthetase